MLIIDWTASFRQADMAIEHANEWINEQAEPPKWLRQLKGRHKFLLRQMLVAYSAQLKSTESMFFMPSFKTNSSTLGTMCKCSDRTVRRCIRDMVYCGVIIAKRSYGRSQNYSLDFSPAILVGKTPETREVIQKTLTEIENSDEVTAVQHLIRSKSPLSYTGNLIKESIKDVEAASEMPAKDLPNKKAISRHTETEDIKAAPAAIAGNKRDETQKNNEEKRGETPRAARKPVLTRWLRQIAGHKTFKTDVVWENRAALPDLMEKVNFLFALIFQKLYINYSFISFSQRIHLKYYILLKFIAAKDINQEFKLMQARVVEVERYAKNHCWRPPLPTVFFDDTRKNSFSRTEKWIDGRYKTHAEWEELRQAVKIDFKVYRGLRNAANTAYGGGIRDYAQGLERVSRFENDKVKQIFNSCFIH